MTNSADKKIVVVQNLDFSPDQIEKLKSLGDATIYDDNPTDEAEWLARVEKADIFCSGSEYMSSEVYKLRNKVACIPMVGYSWLDIEKLKDNNVLVANCPGCNKYAVSEWIVYMAMELGRRFSLSIKTTVPEDKVHYDMVGLRDKKITILGKGNIGSLAGKVLSDLGGQVDYFSRGDNLADKVKDADLVINCLSTNPTTKGLLSDDFFSSMKDGAYFITITTEEVYDPDALIGALSSGKLSMAASDASSIRPGDTSDKLYLKLADQPNIVVTPHISSFSDVSRRTETDMMIENIEAWVKGEPMNIVS